MESHTGSPVLVVHRIDADSSGLVLFAKDAEAHRELNGVFERREVEKVYLAVVLGDVPVDGTVKRALKQFGSGRMGVIRGGKPAITVYKVLERRPDTTLLAVWPKTGKRHQIRVHLWSIGHPILGDPLYGDPRPVGGAPRLMLHALSLAFDTPITGKLSIRAEAPEEFLRGT